MNPFYVKHKTEEEAKEIIELAVANGADERETVGGTRWRRWKYVGVDDDNDTIFFSNPSDFGENATEMTIEEVRKMLKKKSDVSDEWKPEVGGECEVFNRSLGNPDWERATILLMGELIVVYTSESCKERSTNIDLVSFRPLKTNDEIEREETINEMKTILRGHSIIDHQAHYLYTSGYRKLKENEVIVKPLSDEQRSRIKEELRSYAATVEYAIDVVQRELGVIK